MVDYSKRKLYKIGQLTRLLDLTPRTIRYYDQFGLLPHIKRSEGGIRLFDDEDLEIIKRIRRLQKEEFLPLDVIKDRLFHRTDSAQSSRAVVVDGGASIEGKYRDELNITSVPFTVSFNKMVIKDYGAGVPRSFWEKIEKRGLPKIEAPTLDDFEQTYRQLAKTGIKTIYSIHVSRTLSTCFDLATQAAHRVSDEVNVVVIDSKSIGVGQGLFAQMIAQSIHDQDSVETTEILISKLLPLIFELYTLDRLDYLLSDGFLKEVNDGQRQFLTKFLQFKPLLQFREGTGNLEIYSCNKTRDEAVAQMIEVLEGEITNRVKYIKQITVEYVYLYSEAMVLANDLKKRFPGTPVTVVEGSTVVATLVGPEALGIGII